MSKPSWLTVLLLLTPCSQKSCAQELRPGIGGLFRMAEEQSQILRAERTGLAAADETVAAAKAQRLPDISASISFSYLGNGSISDRNFSDFHSTPMPHYDNNFALEAKQVIYAGGAINSGIRQAEISRELAGLGVERNRQEVRFLLTGLYLDIFKLDNQIRVLKRNLLLAEQVLDNMNARFLQGTVLKTDITRYELHREQLRLQLTRTSAARSVANHRLCSTLHLPASAVIVPDSTEFAIPLLPDNEAGWQETAARSHTDLRLAQLNIELNGERLKQERAERRPHVTLMAADRFDGPITIEVPAINRNFNYWYVGIGVNYNLSSLYKGKHRVSRAQREQQQAEERRQLVSEQIETAVQAGFTGWQTARADLHTQESSVRLAGENYSVTANRYANGMALLTDLTDAADVKLAAELGLANARAALAFSYYKMKYLTHTL